MTTKKGGRRKNTQFPYQLQNANSYDSESASDSSQDGVSPLNKSSPADYN